MDSTRPSPPEKKPQLLVT